MCTHDPCVFTGKSPTGGTIYFGTYVDDNIYFGTDDATEKCFETQLEKRITIDWMGDLSWYLGVLFDWDVLDDGRLTVHLSQEAYVEKMTEQHNITGNTELTPFRSGLVTDRIPHDNIPLDRKKPLVKQYQSLIGGLNWMSYSTRPDITAATSLLSRHLQNPSKGHIDAAKHVVRYLKGSQSWGIRYTQPKTDDNQSYDPMNCVKGLAAWPMDVKGVGEMPTLPVVNRLDFYSDSNLGPQDASTPKDGDICTEDEVKSLLGAMSTYLGGPIEWRSIREDRTSRNVCQSEIKAMDEACKILEGNRNFFQDLGSPVVKQPFLLMADNQGGIDWAHSGAITKRLRYWNIREVAIRDAVKAGEVQLSKIPGPINGSDIYTKEYKDKQHFIKLRGSIMSPRGKPTSTPTV